MSSHQTAAGTPPKTRFERTVEALAGGIGNGIGWLAEHGVLFAVFALLWFVVIVSIVLNPAAVDDVWRQIGALPIIVQLVAWLLFLPVMAGLWIWETDWPDVVSIVLILAVAASTLFVMRPTKRSTRPSALT